MQQIPEKSPIVFKKSYPLFRKSDTRFDHKDQFENPSCFQEKLTKRVFEKKQFSNQKLFGGFLSMINDFVTVVYTKIFFKSSLLCN